MIVNNISQLQIGSLYEITIKNNYIALLEVDKDDEYIYLDSKIIPIMPLKYLYCGINIRGHDLRKNIDIKTYKFYGQNNNIKNIIHFEVIKFNLYWIKGNLVKKLQ
jgi:hypothetical protein